MTSVLHKHSVLLPVIATVLFTACVNETKRQGVVPTATPGREDVPQNEMPEEQNGVQEPAVEIKLPDYIPESPATWTQTESETSVQTSSQSESPTDTTTNTLTSENTNSSTNSETKVETQSSTSTQTSTSTATSSSSSPPKSVTGCNDLRLAYDRMSSNIFLYKKPVIDEANKTVSVKKCSELCLESVDGAFASVRNGDGKRGYVSVTRIIYPEDERCGVLKPPTKPLPKIENCNNPRQLFDPSDTVVALRESPGGKINRRLKNCSIVCLKKVSGQWSEVVNDLGTYDGYASSALVIDARTRCP